MTVQEKFIKAYDLAEMGVKSKLKDLHKGSTVDYVVKTCKKGTYTNDEFVLELTQSLVDIARETKEEAEEMYNQIQSI